MRGVPAVAADDGGTVMVMEVGEALMRGPESDAEKIARLEQRLAAAEARIAQLEKDALAPNRQPLSVRHTCDTCEHWGGMTYPFYIGCLSPKGRMRDFYCPEWDERK